MKINIRNLLGENQRLKIVGQDGAVITPPETTVNPTLGVDDNVLSVCLSQFTESVDIPSIHVEFLDGNTIANASSVLITGTTTGSAGDNIELTISGTGSANVLTNVVVQSDLTFTTAALDLSGFTAGTQVNVTATKLNGVSTGFITDSDASMLYLAQETYNVWFSATQNGPAISETLENSTFYLNIEAANVPDGTVLNLEYLTGTGYVSEADFTLPPLTAMFTSDAAGTTPITSINEGDTAYLVVSCSVPDGTAVDIDYADSSTNVSDFSNTLPTSASFTNQKFIISFNTLADQTTESNQTLNVRILESGSVLITKSITVNDTSKSPPPANDDIANAMIISGQSGTVIGDNSSATRQAGEPSLAGNQGGSSVWFKWIAPSSGNISFNTFGTGLDTLMGVFSYNGSGVPDFSALVLIVENDDSPNSGTYESEVTFSAVAGTTYYIAVDGYNGRVGQFNLNWR